MTVTLAWDTLRPAERPTFYFVGVSTGASSIRRVFPLWAEELGLGDVEMVGVDLALHAPREHYRRVVSFLKEDALSLGALVTTHKLDLFAAARDLFDEVDPLAELMGEVSSLSKREGRFWAHAKDPYSAGLAVERIAPAGYFRNRDSDVVLLGAGGSSIAIDWHLSRPERGDDRPRRIVVTNRSAPRLEALRQVHAASGTDRAVETVLAPTPADNDRVVAEAAPGSLVVNATGLGKDAPGSPLTDAVRFPRAGIAWDLNYRGELVFLDQAIAQRDERGLHVHDGWVYFIHGWTQVIAEVFHIDIPPRGPVFDRLSLLAAENR